MEICTGNSSALGDTYLSSGEDTVIWTGSSCGVGLMMVI